MNDKHKKEEVGRDVVIKTKNGRLDPEKERKKKQGVAMTEALQTPSFFTLAFFFFFN